MTTKTTKTKTKIKCDNCGKYTAIEGTWCDVCRIIAQVSEVAPRLTHRQKDDLQERCERALWPLELTSRVWD